jgi:hypothetical protein
MVNHFRAECLGQKHHVVHNKFKRTEGQLCLKVVDGNLEQQYRERSAKLTTCCSGNIFSLEWLTRNKS